MNYRKNRVIKRFEEIIAWQKGQDLAVEIYSEFGPHKDYKFRDQICSAVVSISNNIAEGFDRESNADFNRFLNYLAERLNYISSETADNLRNLSAEMSKIINGLKKSLKNNS
ncbi:MAG: four helix bundle protein [Cyclobacteriaceae bacterium]